MRIQVVSRGIDVSESLRDRAETRIGDIIEKYLGRPCEGFVSVSREGHRFRIDCSVHLPTGMMLQTHAAADDAHAAVEAA
ncbi:MAG: HPF/RaiA family ribosome-associated protein, partial [Caulobacterales bacterium]|nr:HPF/RaiA family ribosome-associated protein [Caulobacterales bacterium]